MTKLQYQTSVLVAGFSYICVESYDSVFERMRMANIVVDTDDPNSMRWLEPIELTIKASFDGGDTGQPTRVAIPPAAISMVMELPPESRVDVDDD